MALSALGVFLLAKKATKNSIIALIPLGIFINESLFLNKFSYAPLVEPIQLPFILFSFYSFIRALEDKKYKKWFVLTSILLGIVISTRFFVTGGVMLFCMLFW
jgi:dolichyl-phosphate-mannose--protein O-mannosyl transferase